MTGLTEQQRADLEVARYLAACGIPLFLGTPDDTKKSGFAVPGQWQQTVADPAVVDLWEPGMALCAVMGCGLDLIDIDPRNSGDRRALDGIMPTVYGSAATPSDGYHDFVASMGVGSRDNTFPGIDVKGGMADGESRGFAFIAPTVGKSKVTGGWVAYRWLQVPDLARLRAGGDGSGGALAARIRGLRGSGSSMSKKAGGPDWWQEFINAREPQSARAAERAITTKLDEVAGWTAKDGIGFRIVLLRAALTLGGYVGGRYLEEDVARERLEEAVEKAWGTPDEDDLKWIQQGLDDGAIQPFHVFTAADERLYSEAALAVAGQVEVPDVAGAGEQWTVLSVLGTEPFDPAGDGSNQGLAKAVAYRMLPALRWATDAKLWVVRERDLWREDSADLSGWAVSVLAELMPLGSSPVPKEISERTEQHWQAVRQAQFMSSAGSGQVAQKLRSILSGGGHPNCLKIANLDANPEVLWAGGVPWDLRASAELPTRAYWVDPGTPHVHSALCTPDPACPTPLWDAFVEAVWPDADIRKWAMRVLSIALTGHADKALPILLGPPDTGKSSLITMLCTVLGSYAHAASPELLSAADNSHPEKVYDLKGRRLSFIDEGPRRGHHATERLKQLTGGAPLTGRAVFGKRVTFTPTHTLVMTTNPEPALTDEAVRKRVRLIPCDGDVEEVRLARVALLRGGLQREAPGILAAAMREAAGYLANPDSTLTSAAPVSICGRAEEIAAEQDLIRRWLDEACQPWEAGTRSHELFRHFVAWCRDENTSQTGIPTRREWEKALDAAKYPVVHTRTRNVRKLRVDPSIGPELSPSVEGGA